MFRRVYGIFGRGLVPSDTHDGTIGQYHYLPKTIVSMNYNEYYTYIKHLYAWENDSECCNKHILPRTQNKRCLLGPRFYYQTLPSSLQRHGRFFFDFSWYRHLWLGII